MKGKQDPLEEYSARLAQRSEKAKAGEKAHIRVGNMRVLFLIGLLALVVVCCRSGPSIGFGLLVLMLGLFATGMMHDRVLNARDRALRAVRFYEWARDRLTGDWAGKGSPGTEFVDPHHPYAPDLDLFGPGSLFELLNATQTEFGRMTLASWLRTPALPEEILSRQAAVNELRPRLDLREKLGVLAAEAQAWIRTESLLAWAQQPRLLDSGPARALIFCLPVLSAILALIGNWLMALAIVAGQVVISRTYQDRVYKVTRSLTSVQRDLNWLAELLHCLEEEDFQSERLKRMNAECECEGILASQAIKRLARLYDWLVSSQNLFLVFICKWFMWETQFAFAIEAWRARFGVKIRPWISRLGQTEALLSLAGHAYDHPGDPFPELLDDAAPAQLEAEALGHPLIVEGRCVRNDLMLGPDRRLVVVSGSNMSGKSTYLRAIGVNLVLALAGAPVRAQCLRMTPLQIGASIRTVDSLQEGTSRFYAEITRLRDIVNLARGDPKLVFLLDEILGGTNSHDRRIGAACVARSLLQRGAMGLMSTHDLALTQIAEELQPAGANFHFEDQLREGRITFDYRLRPGVVQKSNALELMRAVGLDVPT
jgi:hypothetical protein